MNDRGAEARRLEVDLRRFCAEVGADLAVRRVLGPVPPWVLRDGQLLNERADFFRVIALGTPDGGSRLMLEQREIAECALAIADGPQGPSMLLSARTEPGLIGGTCLSTTLQSTPSNFLRRHGGRATPLLEELLDPDAGGRLLHESLQLDWHEHYIAKVKRFRVVRLERLVDAPRGLVWVPLRAARWLLASDLLISGDLRACLTQWDFDQPFGAASIDSLRDPFDRDQLARHRIPLESLRWTAEDGRPWDSRGASVVHVSSSAGSREVTDWVQPLLELPQPRRIDIDVIDDADGRRAVVRPGPDEGLGGWRLLDLPVPPESPEPSGTRRRIVRTSAEGGRFLHHEIVIRVHHHPRVPDGVQGDAVPIPELRRQAGQSLRSSLALRFALSLII